MGQKVNPVGMRVGIFREHESNWYADKNYSQFLLEDIEIRKYLEKELKAAVTSKIVIERPKADEVVIKAFVKNPGIASESVFSEKVSKKLAKLTHKKVNYTAIAVAEPLLDATLVAKDIAAQLEARASFRAAQKKTIVACMANPGCKGIKTSVSGRLGGADIARSEGYAKGVTPLQTLRQDIDFATAEAMTTYGKLGVKVWICRGEFKKDGQKLEEAKGE